MALPSNSYSLETTYLSVNRTIEFTNINSLGNNLTIEKSGKTIYLKYWTDLSKLLNSTVNNYDVRMFDTQLSPIIDINTGDGFIGYINGLFKFIYIDNTLMFFYKQLPKIEVNLNWYAYQCPNMGCYIGGYGMTYYAANRIYDVRMSTDKPLLCIAYNKDGENNFNIRTSNNSQLIQPRQYCNNKNFVHWMAYDKMQTYKIVNWPIRIVNVLEAKYDFHTMESGLNTGRSVSGGTKRTFNYKVKNKIVIQFDYAGQEAINAYASLKVSPFVFVTIDGELCRAIPTDTSFSFRDMYNTDPLDLSVELELLK